MILVADASVALKWFLNVRDGEAERDRVLALLNGVDDGRFQLIQPVGFVAKVPLCLRAQNRTGPGKIY